MTRRKSGAILGALLCLLARPAAQSMAPLPSGWPNRMELGMADSPGGAAAMRATAPFGFRYQYLAGGANTGSGWATWNTNGDFAKFYIQDSVANGIVPVFTVLHVAAVVSGWRRRERRELRQPEQHRTMTAYYNDLKLFFQKAGAFPCTRWSCTSSRTSGATWSSVRPATTPRRVPAKVSETGLSELAGLPSNVAGFAQAVVKLRDTYAPNVFLGYHISVWGTGIDIALSNPPDATVDARGARREVLQVARRQLRRRVRRVQRPRRRLQPVSVRRRRRSWWDAERLPPQRALPRAASPPRRESASSCGRSRSATRRCER